MGAANTEESQGAYSDKPLKRQAQRGRGLHPGWGHQQEDRRNEDGVLCNEAWGQLTHLRALWFGIMFMKYLLHLLIFLKKCLFRGAWVAQLVERPTSAQVTISRFVSSSPVSGSVLMAQSLEPVSDSVSPSLSAPPCSCSVSLSQK